jgi:hypothetical protein
MDDPCPYCKGSLRILQLVVHGWEDNHMCIEGRQQQFVLNQYEVIDP